MIGLLEIYKTLLNAYRQRYWRPAKTPFEMMAILRIM